MTKLIHIIIILLLLSACGVNPIVTNAVNNIVIAETDSAQDFIAHYTGGFGISGGRNFADMFCDDFFSENYLVAFELEQGSTALEYRVASVQANGDIILRRLENLGLAGMAHSYWTIVIELDNRFAPDNFNVVFEGSSRRIESPVEVIRRDISAEENNRYRENSIVRREFITESTRPALISENVREFFHTNTGVYTIHNDGSFWAFRNNYITQSAISVWLMDNAQTIIGSSHLFIPNSVIDENGTLWRWDWQTREIVLLMENVRWADGELIITNEGRLYSWGDNRYGQIGDGTRTNRHEPIYIMNNIRAAYQVSFINNVGGYRMAVTESGELYAWGRNHFGQLGDGTTEDRHTPVRIMENVRDVFLNLYTVTAVTEDGDIWEWGRDMRGGNNQQRPFPVNISASRDSALTIVSNYSPNWSSHQWREAPIQNVERLYVQSEWRNNTYFALTRNGDLWTWETEINEREAEISRRPSRVMRNVASVHVGEDYVLALRTNNSLWAFGENERGQLGDGTHRHRRTPVRIMNNVTEVSVRGGRNIALTTNGNLYAWGANMEMIDSLHTANSTIYRAFASDNNDRPFFGINETPFPAPPEIVREIHPIMEGVRRIANDNGNVAFALREDNSLWRIVSHDFMRDNSNLEPGSHEHILDNVWDIEMGNWQMIVAVIGDSAFHFDPYQNEIVLERRQTNGITRFHSTASNDEIVRSFQNISRLFERGDTTYVLTSCNNLWGWGSNIGGMLGDGTTTRREDPVHIIRDVRTVVQGEGNIMTAITGNRTLWAWGFYDNSLVGEVITNRFAPVRIMEDVIFATSHFAITSNGTLYAWRPDSGFR
jgi:alpha-tubulin suppressor-like RCC1 family protein